MPLKCTRKIPNPNSQITPSPSSSNPPNHNNSSCNNKRIAKTKFSNRATLPEELWFLILSKLGTIHIIENVQKVCTLFRRICTQPAMFRVIDMTLPHDFRSSPFHLDLITRQAVDRSAGELVDIYVEFPCFDRTLMYIASRSKNLKHLRIGGQYCNISEDVLIASVQKLPMLEEVEINIRRLSHGTVEALGRVCPTLRSFSVYYVGPKHNSICDDGFGANENAFAIAKSMPNLRRLQVIGSFMTNEGLKAVLDGCPLLETLDLRACSRLDLSGALGNRCHKIKRFLRPCDSP